MVHYNFRYLNGSQCWCKDDKKHRVDGPAIIYSDGDQYWYQDDKLHREDGPTIIVYLDGTKCWYLNNVKIASNDLK
jgi:hypothetical protein